MKVFYFIFFFLSFMSFAQKDQLFEIDYKTNENIIYDNNLLKGEKAILGKEKNSLLEFFRNNSKYEILDFEITDLTIFYSFKIDEKGKCYDLEIIDSPSKLHTKELKRLIRIMPDWKPAKVEDKFVKVEVMEGLTIRI